MSSISNQTQRRERFRDNSSGIHDMKIATSCANAGSIVVITGCKFGQVSSICRFASALERRRGGIDRTQ